MRLGGPRGDVPIRTFITCYFPAVPVGHRSRSRRPWRRGFAGATAAPADSRGAASSSPVAAAAGAVTPASALARLLDRYVWREARSWAR